MRGRVAAGPTVREGADIESAPSLTVGPAATASQRLRSKRYAYPNA